MIVFRFGITFENNDLFLREVELLANQTFEDLHYYIVNELKLDSNKEASFFLCDHKFRKQQEITLLDSTAKKLNEQLDNEDQDEAESGKRKKILVMNEHKVSDQIDDPRQKLLYVYDFDKNFTFFIELLKLSPTNSPGDFPRTVKQEGKIPREFRPKPVKPEDKGDSNDDQSEEEASEKEDYPEITDSLNIDIAADEENLSDDESFEQDEPEDDDK